LIVRHEASVWSMRSVECTTNVLDVVLILIDELLQGITGQFATAALRRAGK
jgi:hypothetical protein